MGKTYKDKHSRDRYYDEYSYDRKNVKKQKKKDKSERSKRRNKFDQLTANTGDTDDSFRFEH